MDNAPKIRLFHRNNCYMKYPALIFFLLFSASLSAQIQLKQEIVELSANADLIVRGKIVDVGNFLFEVEVSKVYVGKKPEGNVSVKRFRNNKVAKRWGKYVEGEELLLYLKDDGANYGILGVNGEGEKLIVGDKIYLDSRGGAVFGRFAYNEPGPKTRIYSEEVDLENFLFMVARLRDCYEISYKEKANRAGEMEFIPVAKRICADVDFEDIQMASDVALKLVQKAEKLVPEEQ